MGVNFTLEKDRREVTPGGDFTLSLSVTNSGPQVDQFRISLRGLPGTVVTSEPPVINLEGGRHGDARVRVHVPVDAQIRAGRQVAGVHVWSPNHPESQQLREFELLVAPNPMLRLSVLKRGRRNGRYQSATLAVANTGNVPLRLHATGSDPKNLVRVDLPEESLDIAPFETVQLDALLRGPLQVFGQPTIHTIKFRAEGMKLDSSADYTLVQKAWLGRSVKPYVVVLAAALAIFMLWPRYLVLGDFRGQELDTVNEILEEAGITPEIREQNSTQQAGTVIETMPVAGERVRIGGVLGFLSDPVEIVASSGPKTLPIPDVFNKLEAAAVAALGELDALGVEIEYESRPSEQIADGFVMGTEPASGSLQSGDTLKVVVSSGPEDVPVPDFTGETSEGALVVAEAARLKTRDVPLPVTDPSQNNLVVDQLPKPGELVMVGRTVIVYIGVFEDPGESTTTTAAG